MASATYSPLNRLSPTCLTSGQLDTHLSKILADNTEK